jgi:peptidoglycan/LPS O-acetylase OafA/YrhL
MKRRLFRIGTLAISVVGLLTLLALPASADDSGHAVDTAVAAQINLVTSPAAGNFDLRVSTELRFAVWEW